MRVHFDPAAPTDLFGDTMTPSGASIAGTLTTDHPASSYGLPVVVADDGRVFGPADLPAGNRAVSDTLGAGHLHADLVAAARAAGYVVASPTCPA